MSGPLTGFDFTCYNMDTTEGEILSFLRTTARKAKFQLEECPETKRLHWQGRLQLLTKLRITGLPKLCDGGPLAGSHWSVTQTDMLGNYGYVGKAPTSVRGPWALDDPEPMYIPRQIREIKTLRPFQQQIIDLFQVWDTRTINILYCPSGNIGKSIIRGWCYCYGIARTIPCMREYKDLMRAIMDMPPSKCYIVDMPRAMKKDKMGEFYAGLETIKDGYCYDDRYTFADKYMDCPNIWVFTNTLPAFDLMSPDRWKVWGLGNPETDLLLPYKSPPTTLVFEKSSLGA